MKVLDIELGKVSLTLNGTWREDKEYERLCVVNNGIASSYISKKFVPAGTELTNIEYWQPVVDLNPELINKLNNFQALHEEILQYFEDVQSLLNQMNELIDDAEHIGELTNQARSSASQAKSSATSASNSARDAGSYSRYCEEDRRVVETAKNAVQEIANNLQEAQNNLNELTNKVNSIEELQNAITSHYNDVVLLHNQIVTINSQLTTRFNNLDSELDTAIGNKINQYTNNITNTLNAVENGLNSLELRISDYYLAIQYNYYDICDLQEDMEIAISRVYTLEYNGEGNKEVEFPRVFDIVYKTSTRNYTQNNAPDSIKFILDYSPDILLLKVDNKHYLQFAKYTSNSTSIQYRKDLINIDQRDINDIFGLMIDTNKCTGIFEIEVTSYKITYKLIFDKRTINSDENFKYNEDGLYYNYNSHIAEVEADYNGYLSLSRVINFESTNSATGLVGDLNGTPTLDIADEDLTNAKYIYWIGEENRNLSQQELTTIINNCNNLKYANLFVAGYDKIISFYGHPNLELIDLRNTQIPESNNINDCVAANDKLKVLYMPDMICPEDTIIANNAICENLNLEKIVFGTIECNEFAGVQFMHTNPLVEYIDISKFNTNSGILEFVNMDNLRYINISQNLKENIFFRSCHNLGLNKYGVPTDWIVQFANNLYDNTDNEPLIVTLPNHFDSRYFTQELNLIRNKNYTITFDI